MVSGVFGDSPAALGPSPTGTSTAIATVTKTPELTATSTLPASATPPVVAPPLPIQADNVTVVPASPTIAPAAATPVATIPAATPTLPATATTSATATPSPHVDSYDDANACARPHAHVNADLRRSRRNLHANTATHRDECPVERRVEGRIGMRARINDIARMLVENDVGLFEVMRTCRAMRRLRPDPVPEALLVSLIEAAQQAPSGSNQQNGRWLIVRDQTRKDRLAALNRKAVESYLDRRPDGLSSLPEPEATSQRRILGAIRWQSEHMAEAPALIVACLAMRNPPADSSISGLGAGGSVWPGVQNLLLAARGLGLGAALTTLALSDRAAFKEVVELPAGIEPLCLIPIGYPTGNFGPTSRRPVEEILRWDTWS